jgi:hypothetical protein
MAAAGAAAIAQPMIGIKRIVEDSHSRRLSSRGRGAAPVAEASCRRDRSAGL